MTNHTTSVLLTVLLTYLSVDASQQTRTPLRDVINKRGLLQACTEGTRPLVLAGSSGTFTSPEYPGNYPNNLLCQWLIVLPDPNNVVQLNFEALSTEARNDTIVIYDGSAVNTQKIVTGFDGTNWEPLPVAINSNEPYVLFEFKTNYAVTSTGFKVSYTSADKSVTANDPCSVLHRPLIIREYSGVFDSKGFPHYYYNYANCQWLIESQEPGGVVRLDFTYFYTEFFFDAVTIHDGQNASAPVIGRVHGFEPEAPALHSTQKYMFVQFVSDERDVAPGFQARFTSLRAHSV